MLTANQMADLESAKLDIQNLYREEEKTEL